MNLEEQLDFAVDFADELGELHRDLLHSIDRIDGRWSYSILPARAHAGSWVEVFTDYDFDALISNIRGWWGDCQWG